MKPNLRLVIERSNAISECDPFDALKDEPTINRPPRYYAPGWARLREEYE
jgi:hypothetical protein